MLSSTDLFLLNQEHQKHLEESTGKKSTPVVEDQAPTSHLEESADEPALLQNPDPIDETLLLPYFPNTKPILFPTALYPAPSADYNIFTDTRYAQSLYHLNFAPPHHLDYNPSQYTNTYPPQNAPSNNAIHPSLAHLFRHDPYGRPAPFPHRAEAAPAPQKGKARTMTTYFNSEGVVSAVYAQVGVYELTVNNVQVMRRQKDHWVNATQILKAAGIDKSQRTKILDRVDYAHEKIQGGYGKFQGTWVALEDARDLANIYGIFGAVKPLIELKTDADLP